MNKLVNNEVGKTDSTSRVSDIFLRYAQKTMDPVEKIMKGVVWGIAISAVIISSAVVNVACGDNTTNRYYIGGDREKTHEMADEQNDGDEDVSAELQEEGEAFENGEIDGDLEAEEDITENIEEDLETENIEDESDLETEQETEIVEEGPTECDYYYSFEVPENTLMGEKYSFSTPETSDDANPFSDGEGGYLNSTVHPNETLLRIDGSMFEDFEDYSVNHDTHGMRHDEKQELWVRGVWTNDGENTAAGISNLVYKVTFSTEGEDFGIPVCTSAEGINNNLYASCKDPNSAIGIDHATETHRVAIKFLGERWMILKMVNGYPGTSSEDTVTNGGRVSLGREKVSGVLNIGDFFWSDGLKIMIHDVFSNHQNTPTAVIAIYGPEGQLLNMAQIKENQTIDMYATGFETQKLHAYKIAPGYTLEANWIKLAVLSEKLELEDGIFALSDDYGYMWKVTLGWKNKGADENDIEPDHLRTIMLEGNVNANIEMEPNTYIPIIGDTITPWNFYFLGQNNDNNGVFAIAPSNCTVNVE